MEDVPEADRGRFSRMLYQYLLDDVARKQLTHKTNESIDNILMGHDDIELTEIGKRRKEELIRTRSVPRPKHGPPVDFQSQPFNLGVPDYSGRGWGDDDDDEPGTPGHGVGVAKGSPEKKGGRRLSF